VIFVCLNFWVEKSILEKKKKKHLPKDKMGHLVNPIGVRLNYSLTWSDSWSATDRAHYFSYYSNSVLVKTYLNYFFSREYVEAYGIFFSHFSVFWSSNKFMVEVNLYDGRVEDWIETCTNLFSQDLKRIVSYSLRVFKISAKNVEFVRSFDYMFFRFVATLLLKLVHKLDENLLQQVYFKAGSNSRQAGLVSGVMDFLVLRGQKEDLTLKKSASLLKFFLRLFCLLFYQIPLYGYLINELRFDLFSVLGARPHVSVLGVENKNVTSSFISRFLARKLAQKYRWAELMASLRKELNYMTDTEKLLYGYKIQFHGRFTRRSRSESVSSGYGRVSTSTISAPIDYASSSLTLRNGAGSVKVWLYRAPRFKSFSYKVL